MHTVFAQNLKKARLKAGKTQQEVARQLNIAQNTYSGWERGLHEPKIEYLTEIADMYDLNLRWLLSDSDFEVGATCTCRGTCGADQLTHFHLVEAK